MTTSRLKDLAFITFFAFSITIVLGYFVLLFNKIITPSFRPLESDDFVWLGILVIGLLSTDFLIIRRFRRRAKKTRGA